MDRGPSDASDLAFAIDALRSSNPGVKLLHLEPSCDEIQLFVHSIMSFSAGRELLSYGQDSGRKFFAGPGSAKLPKRDDASSRTGALQKCEPMRLPPAQILALSEEATAYTSLFRGRKASMLEARIDASDCRGVRIRPPFSRSPAPALC